LLVVFVFFFQAEDGIRDRTVTGVQTCALPICRRIARAGFFGSCALVSPAQQRGTSQNDDARSARFRDGIWSPGRAGGALGCVGRSEERRVGEEGGWGGGADHGKSRVDR